MFSFHSAVIDLALLIPMRVAYERLVFVRLILLRHVPEILTHREAFNQDKGAGGCDLSRGSGVLMDCCSYKICQKGN